MPEVEHTCTHEDCEEPVNPKRWALGYRTCLKHGERAKEFPTAPAYNKGGYQLITAADLKDIGRKTTADG